MRTRWLIGLSLALLLALLVVPVAQAAPPESSSVQSCGYWYTVQPGDSWSRLSARTGISIAALQAANPAHIHPHNWLYVGHTLWIPCGAPPPPPPPPTCGYWYTVRSGDSWSRLSSVTGVQPGDSWSRISQHTGVPLNTLYAANPGKVRPPSYVIYVGEVLCIP